MAVDLSPYKGNNIFEGEAGTYASWLNYAVIADAKLGAGLLTLKSLGFALPHYTDSAKVGYVLEGSGVVGMVVPGEAKERALLLRKGDVVTVGLGSLSWWYNGEDEDFVVVFLGDTSTAIKPGDFTYFLLAGGMGILNGFSIPFLARASGTGEDEAEKLFRSQSGVLLIKLKEKLPELKFSETDREGIVLNIEEAPQENDGKSITITGDSMSALKGLGFSANMMKIGADGILSPGFFPDSAVQLIYVTRGSGHVQIAGTNGGNVLDADAKDGDLFMVPSFFGFSVIAGNNGMEWFSIITSSKPFFSQIIGKPSLLFNTLEPKIVEVSLGVDPELMKIITSNGNANDAVFPQSNCSN